MAENTTAENTTNDEIKELEIDAAYDKGYNSGHSTGYYAGSGDMIVRILGAWLIYKASKYLVDELVLFPRKKINKKWRVWLRAEFSTPLPLQAPDFYSVN